MAAAKGNKYAEKAVTSNKVLFIRINAITKEKAKVRSEARGMSLSQYVLALIAADLRGPVKKRK